MSSGSAASYKRGTLSKDREKLLQDLGFEWQVMNPNSWMARYQELADFKATHGHCRVPDVYEDNKPLGSWMGSSQMNAS
jgi:hypothetical protein